MKNLIFALGLFSITLSNALSFEKKCAFNSYNEQFCIHDSVLLKTDSFRGAVPYAMIVDLFENEEGHMMAKISKPLVTGPTHASNKYKILIVPVDDLTL